MPSRWRSARQWAFAAATMPPLLGPAAALARLQPGAAHALYRQWAKLQLEQLGIALHVHDESGLNGRGGVLFVDLHQQTLLTSIVYPSAFPQPLPRGAEVTVVERRDSWTKVRIASGADGWVPDGAVERVTLGQ